MGNGTVTSINVARVRSVDHDGRVVTTGIFKEPVAERTSFAHERVGSDEQADLQAHGGPDRAAYAYAAEDYDWWRTQLGRALAPGTFGENLTLAGVDVNGAVIGERWRVGSALLQVSSPRVPCYKLAMRMDDPTFVKKFADALRPGAYLRVLEEGDASPGDRVEVVDTPSHGLTLVEMTRIYFFDREHLRRLLDAPELPDHWRDWVMEKTASA